MTTNFHRKPMQCEVCRQWYMLHDDVLPMYDSDGNFVCRKCRTKSGGNYSLSKKKPAVGADKSEPQGEQLKIG